MSGQVVAEGRQGDEAVLDSLQVGVFAFVEVDEAARKPVIRLVEGVGAFDERLFPARVRLPGYFDTFDLLKRQRRYIDVASPSS